MPVLTFSTAMTANQLGLNPLSGWQYEFVPWPARVKLVTNATTTGVRLTLYTGSQTICQRQPVQGGASAGVIPAELNTPPIGFMAAAGDRLILQFDEVAAGTPTVNGVIYVDPA